MPELKGDLAQVWERYQQAVGAYSISESRHQLEIGRWAQAVLDVGLENITDLGQRRTQRALLVKQCQQQLIDARLTSNVDRYLRLWAVAQMFGSKEARILGVGKVSAFEPCLYRDKQGETWDWKDTIPQHQRELVQAVWAMACTTKMSAQAVEDEVKIALGKRMPHRKHKPDAAEPDAAECARQMTDLLYQEPYSELVWHHLGAEARLSEADAAAFVAGLVDAGGLEALTALAKVADAAIARLTAHLHGQLKLQA